MNTPATASNRLVGDIGGTNTRLALYDTGRAKLTQIRTYLNNNFTSLEDVIARWLEESNSEQGDTAIPACCLAVAAPPLGDRVKMMNVDWSFSKRALAEQFGFAQLGCINDFEGNAYALPHLSRSDLITLRGAYIPAGKKCAVMGPGTGLGGATLDNRGESPVATASEPGYTGLSPATQLELEVFRVLLTQHSEVWAELLLSGPGLERLQQALAEVNGQAVQPLSAAEITSAALNGDDHHCVDTLKMFCALLGSACGDYVLATGSYGGLFIAGGIVPRISELVSRSKFLDRFCNKGKMAELLSAVPVHIVTDSAIGLRGAAHAPL